MMEPKSLDILHHNDEIVIAYWGPCPDEFLYALQKAKTGMEGYGIVKNATFAEYLPGQILSRWDTRLGLRNGETSVLEQLQAEKAQLEKELLDLSALIVEKQDRLKFVEKEIKNLKN